MNNPPEKKKAIGALGLTGVGKSTMVDIAVRELGYEGFYEKPANNPYINKMYSDPKMYALRAQMWFLIDKHKILKAAKQKINQLSDGKRAAFDMAPWGDGIHAYRHYMVGNINEDEYRTNYEPVFDQMIALLAAQLFSTVYYLTAEIDTVLKRIKDRGRPYEQKIVAEDLFTLQTATMYWLDRIAQQGVKVVTFDTEHVDLANNPQHQKNFAQFINKTESE
jgi:deoxyadenosine/deoxycytidine kinase